MLFWIIIILVGVYFMANVDIDTDKFRLKKNVFSFDLDFSSTTKHEKRD